MTIAIEVLALLIVLEILGRVLYPISREARSKREARRDHRRDLPYLGRGGDATTLLRDLYLLEKCYMPFLGWLSAPNVRLSTIETNAHGFRDTESEPRKQGEYRILITGASFAWGLGASSNAMTVAGQLEVLLNQSGSETRYRVMSGSFFGWSSREEYFVVTEFFDIFDPDLVISLSGYNDLRVLSKGTEIDTLPEWATLLGQAVANQVQPLGTLRALRKLVGTLGVWRLVVLLREEIAARAPPARQIYKYDVKGAAPGIERVVRRYLSIADFLARTGRQYLIALEPEIYSSSKPLTVEEFDLKSRFQAMNLDLAPTLTRYRRDLSDRLAALAGERFGFRDLANVFDNESAPIFIDYNHVCDRGNLLVARALVDALEESGVR